MDDSSHARIADFGLAMVTQNLDSMLGTSCHRGHTTRWAAPEVLSGGSHTKEADIFSFAMVMIEVLLGRSVVCGALAYYCLTPMQVFTGAIPFSDSSSVMAMLAITQGLRPLQPKHPAFTEKLWTLMKRCWDHNPNSRPDVTEALQILLIPSVSCSFHHVFTNLTILLCAVKIQPGKGLSAKQSPHMNASL